MNRRTAIPGKPRVLLGALWGLLLSLPLFGQEAAPTAAEMTLPGDEPVLSSEAAEAETSFFQDLAPTTGVEIAPEPVQVEAQASDGNFQIEAREQTPSFSILPGLGSADRFYDGLGGIPRPALIDLRAPTSMESYAFRVGPVRVRPRVGIGFNFTKRDDQGSQADSRAIFIGGLTALIGKPEVNQYLLATYDATYNLRTSGRETSNFNQELSLQGAHTFTKLSLLLGLRYTKLTGSDREFSQGVDRQLVTVTGTARYQLTEISGVELVLDAPLRQYSSAGISSQETRLTGYYNYSWTPKTQLSLGVAGGYVTVDQGTAQTYEQLLLRVRSTSSAALFYTGTLGVEYRQASRDMVTPIFALGVTWTPAEGRALSLVAERRVVNSALLQDTNYTSTTATLNYQQRIGARFTANPSLGYEWASYEGNSPDPRSNSREDHTYFTQFSLSAALFQHGVWSTAVSYRITDSTVNDQNFLQASTQFIYQY